MAATFGAFGLAAAYYVSISLLFQITLAINVRVAPESPWPIALAVVIGASSLVWPGRSLSRWAIIPPHRGDFGWILTFLFFGILLCCATLISQGSFFRWTARAPLFPSKVGPALAVTTALGSGLFAALTEELTFRGILQGRLSDVVSRWTSIGASTAPFLLLHIQNDAFWAQSGFYLCLSVSAGYLASITQSLGPAIALHTVVNILLTGVVLIHGPIRMDTLPDALRATAIVILAVSALAMLISAKHLYRLDTTNTSTDSSRA